jgi:integrin beta 3
MRDLDALMTQMGERLGAMIQPMFKRLEMDLTAKLLAGTVREALIDRQGALVLTFGDGSIRNLGPVVGQNGANGADADDERLALLERRLDVHTIIDAALTDGVLMLTMSDGSTRELGSVIGPAGPVGPAGSNGEPADPVAIQLLEARIDALDGRALVDAAVVDGELVLSLGDGSTRELGNVMGPAGSNGEPADPMELAELAKRVEVLSGLAVVDANLADGVLMLTLGNGELRELGPVVGPAGPQGPPGVDHTGEALEAAQRALEGRLDGIEGRTITEALIDRDGGLVLVLGDGSSLAVGRVVGRDGIDGKDGLNGERGESGFGFDDFDVTVGDDGRTLRLSFERGDTVQAYELDFPTMIYRGVYQPETDYVRGDAVTFGGSVWVCNQPTRERPGEVERAWTLAVKRGRDGKDFAGPQPRGNGK